MRRHKCTWQRLQSCLCCMKYVFSLTEKSNWMHVATAGGNRSWLLITNDHAPTGVFPVPRSAFDNQTSMRLTSFARQITQRRKHVAIILRSKNCVFLANWLNCMGVLALQRRYESSYTQSFRTRKNAVRSQIYCDVIYMTWQATIVYYANAIDIFASSQYPVTS